MPTASIPPLTPRRLADRLGAAGLAAAHKGATERAKRCARALRRSARAVSDLTTQPDVEATCVLDGAARDIEIAADPGRRRRIAGRIAPQVIAAAFQQAEAQCPGETFEAVRLHSGRHEPLSADILHRAAGIVSRTEDGRLRERSAMVARAIVFQLAAVRLRAFAPLGIADVLALAEGVPILARLDVDAIHDQIMDAAEAVAGGDS